MPLLQARRVSERRISHRRVGNQYCIVAEHETVPGRGFHADVGGKSRVQARTGAQAAQRGVERRILKAVIRRLVDDGFVWQRLDEAVVVGR